MPTRACAPEFSPPEKITSTHPVFPVNFLLPVPSELAEKVRAHMFPVVADGVTYRGDMFGLPVENQLTGLMYNTRVLTELGLGEAPTTWEEFAATARRITKYHPDGGIDVPGATTLELTLTTKRRREIPSSVLPHLRSRSRQCCPL